MARTGQALGKFPFSILAMPPRFYTTWHTHKKQFMPGNIGCLRKLATSHPRGFAIYCTVSNTVRAIGIGGTASLFLCLQNPIVCFMPENTGKCTRDELKSIRTDYTSQCKFAEVINMDLVPPTRIHSLDHSCGCQMSKHALIENSNQSIASKFFQKCKENYTYIRLKSFQNEYTRRLASPPGALSSSSKCSRRAHKRAPRNLLSLEPNNFSHPPSI